MNKFFIYIFVLLFVFNCDVHAKVYDLADKMYYQKAISSAYMVDDEIVGDNNYLDGSNDEEEVIINYTGEDNKPEDPEPEDPEPEDPEPEDPEPEDLEPEDPDSEDTETDNEDPEEGENQETQTNNDSSDGVENPINVTVNSELNRDDINTINEKLDKLADLIYKLTISLWSLFGLLLGTKLLRGIFNG